MLLRGDMILIATGSSPVRPPSFPFDHDRVHDSDEVLQLERLPRSMAVIGAGVIGCEYACTFAALGTKVWLIDGRDELLPFLDQEISAALEAAMRRSSSASSSSGTCKVTSARRRWTATSRWSSSRAARCLWMPCWSPRGGSATPPR